MIRSVRLVAGLLLGACLLVAAIATSRSQSTEWPGVDDAVIGRFVAEAGRPPARPVLDWVRGDALLFAFLCAGLIAGFLLGFWWRALFVERVGRPATRIDDHA